jgi:lipopolysaccharide transport system ATP-binding protein
MFSRRQIDSVFIRWRPSHLSLVRVDGIWKRYKIPHENRDSILDQVAGTLQLLKGGRFTYEEFWALKDISFSLSRGESLGIIGANGSGKSTLLKVIARIIRPTRGSFEVSGKVAPILELGVGFQPELNIRDNILIYASILGRSNRETKARTGSILEFAGLQNFADSKLKNLSSGMQARLAFSVAMETDPDVYLIDEGLAVGDLDFQLKCLEKFRALQEQGKSLVLVSHSLGLISDFCHKALLLSKGEVVASGDTAQVIQRYTALHPASNSS